MVAYQEAMGAKELREHRITYREAKAVQVQEWWLQARGQERSALRSTNVILYRAAFGGKGEGQANPRAPPPPQAASDL